MTSEPLISVILPTYNRMEYLPETVESILNQTLSDFELIIIDDGSSDNTAAWVKSQTDQRIKYIGYSKNQGVSYARNLGLDAAKGKYIAFTDSDDLNEKTRFEEQIALLESENEITICGSDIRFFGLMNGVYTYRENEISFRAKALFQSPFHFPACTVRRSFLEKENIRFRPEIRSADDYYFLMKVMAKGKAKIIKKPLYRYRWHNASISLKRKEEQKQNELGISQLAFQEILNLELSDRETELLYRFKRGEYIADAEKKITVKTVHKLTNHIEQFSNFDKKEKRDLINLMTQIRLGFEGKKVQLLWFLIKKKVRNFKK
jgi:glycosyltransferase involved in cell wall biosynthesis